MTIRLGVIGMSPGNGHPYSWSAICNGYNAVEMQSCGFPVIPDYLAQQNWPAARLPGVEVTHVWTQDRSLSKHIASAALIPNVVDQPDQMLGHIDALLLARDDAANHQNFAEPFLRAGLPIYIDKPVALNLASFDSLYSLQSRPGQIFSCSALRFAAEMRLSIDDHERIGKPRLITGTISKYWETYGIHLIDPLLMYIGHHHSPQRLFSAPVASDGRVLGLRFGEEGPDVVLTTLGSKCLGPAELCFYGETGWSTLTFLDSFSAFRAALAEFLKHVRLDCRVDSQNFNRRAVEILEMGRI